MGWNRCPAYRDIAAAAAAAPVVDPSSLESGYSIDLDLAPIRQLALVDRPPPAGMSQPVYMDPGIPLLMHGAPELAYDASKPQRSYVGVSGDSRIGHYRVGLDAICVARGVHTLILEAPAPVSVQPCGGNWVIDDVRGWA